MKTSSCKAKGRRLQQEVRDALLHIGVAFGLVEGDIESRGMGQSGVDLVLSPAAQKVFSYDIECKNVERLNVVGVFQAHSSKYADSGHVPLLIHSRNFTEPMVTMRFMDFLKMLPAVLLYERHQKES